MTREAPEWLSLFIQRWMVQETCWTPCAPKPFAARLAAQGRDPDTRRFRGRPVSADALANAQRTTPELPVPSLIDDAARRRLERDIDLVVGEWVRQRLPEESDARARDRWRIASASANRRSSAECCSGGRSGTHPACINGRCMPRVCLPTPTPTLTRHSGGTYGTTESSPRQR